MYVLLYQEFFWILLVRIVNLIGIFTLVVTITEVLHRSFVELIAFPALPSVIGPDVTPSGSGFFDTITGLDNRVTGSSPAASLLMSRHEPSSD